MIIAFTTGLPRQSTMTIDTAAGDTRMIKRHHSPQGGTGMALLTRQVG